MGNVQYMEFDTAVQEVVRQAERLAVIKSVGSDGVIDHTELELFAEKFVLDVMDYCHRTDFPRTLAYTGAELAVKYILDARRTDDGAPGPLKSLKENDVQFEWAVGEVSPIGCISEHDFNSIRPKLNLYRKVVWSNG